MSTSTEETLRAAITDRRPVSLGCDGGAKRTVHPHAIYRTSAGRQYVDGYQIDGPTSSGTALPAWRQFDLVKISTIDILDGRFQVDAKFDPASTKYASGLLVFARS